MTSVMIFRASSAIAIVKMTLVMIFRASSAIADQSFALDASF
jgi:hypothetical protein